MQRAHSPVVAAAFAQDRGAAYAVRLVRAVGDIDAAFTLRNVMNERGTVEMVVLETTLADPRQAGRVETLMTGANGMIVPVEVVAGARRAG